MKIKMPKQLKKIKRGNEIRIFQWRGKGGYFIARTNSKIFLEPNGFFYVDYKLVGYPGPKDVYYNYAVWVAEHHRWEDGEI